MKLSENMVWTGERSFAEIWIPYPCGMVQTREEEESSMSRSKIRESIGATGREGT